jgi:hypothetical protein
MKPRSLTPLCSIPRSSSRSTAWWNVACEGWHEVALWWPERRVLVVAELIGTTGIHALDGGPAGMHPVLRLPAPGALRGYDAEHLLVGHGRGVHGPAAAEALARAYAGARKDLPRLLGRLPAMARAAVATRKPT